MRISTRHIITLLLGVVLLFSASCKRNKDAASKQFQGKKPSPEAVTYTEGQKVDLLSIDTAYYYYGMVEDSSYIFKIDKKSPSSLSGHYYRVGNSAWVKAEPFKITYKNRNYYFEKNGVKKEIRFSITIDTASIFGDFTTTQIGLLDKTLDFERYRKPVYVEYDSKRFCDSAFHVDTQTDVIYGKAKGYWCSYPLNDTKYLKMMTKTIGKTASQRNLDLAMDVYMPADDTMKLHPLIMFIHGGAFYFGDKGESNMTNYCRHFAAEGYVTASINYRMGFLFTKPSIQKCGYIAIQDAHAALRYLVANARKFGIDTTAIFVAGASAGAITAMNVALLTNNTRPTFVHDLKLDQKFGKLESSGNNLHNTFKIKGIANLWGALYDLSVIKNNRIPIISFHGTEDDIVPYDEGIPFSFLTSGIGGLLFDKMYGSKSIHKKMDELHIHNKFYPIEGAGHSPFQDPDGKLNQHYYFIQSKINDFFYDLLCGNCSVSYDKLNPRSFSLSNDHIKAVSWEAKGGFITKVGKNSVDVIWAKDAPSCTLIVSGQLDNGATFTKQLHIKTK